MTVYAFRGTDDEAAEPAATIPDCNGKPVSAVRVRLSATTGLPTGDGVHWHDELVRFVVECRVQGVNFAVNDKNGHLERIESYKVLEITEQPWDEA
jgi:hypothetical protein